MAQRLAASGAGPADEGVEGGHRRRRDRARILVRRARRGGRARANGTTTARRSPSGSEQLDGVRGEVLEPSGVDKVPRLKIVWDRARFPLDGAGLRDAVLDGEPRVMLDDNSATDNSIAIDPFQLQPGEAAQVGDAIVAALRASLTNRPPATRAPGPQIAGEWELRVDFMHGARTHRLALEQQRRRHRRPPALGAVRRAGQRRDRRRPDIRFAFGGRHEAATISYRFEGKRRGRRDGRHGVARRRQRPEPAASSTARQFGAGAWEARLWRVACRPTGHRIDLPSSAVRKSETRRRRARRRDGRIRRWTATM